MGRGHQNRRRQNRLICNRRDVRFGSEADISQRSIHVRFTPESGRQLQSFECPLCAKSGPGVRLFNDVVGAGKQLLRHGQTKGLRCPKIDC